MLSSFRAFRKIKGFSLNRAFSAISQPINDLGFKTSYDQEQTDKILNVINKSSLLEFKNYQISHQRVQRIIKRREAKGNFESIEDVLEVDGFGIKVLEKFCNSIINHKEITEDNTTEKLTEDLSNKNQIDSKKRQQQFLTPTLLEVIRNKVKTIVSFHIDLNYFAWTKIYYDRQADEKRDESKFYVEGWNCIEFSNQDKNLRLADLVELLVKFNDQIPDADIYTMEALPTAVQSKQPGSALQINVNIQKTQLVAMLSILLASRRSTNKLFIGAENEFSATDADSDQKVPYIDSVYFLKSFLPSRFYRIFIGNERVSSANVINNIISYNYTVHDNYNPAYASVNIPEEYREFWNKSSRIQQEYLGSSMLVGLTFLKLCIERCSGSLESLNSRVIKKN